MTDLSSKTSLQAAGFNSSPAQQEDFLARVVAKQYAVVELVKRPALVNMGAAALSLVGAGALLARGASAVAIAAVVSGAWHAAIAFARERKRRRRALEQGPPDHKACFRKDGELLPRLEDGEEILYAASPQGNERSSLRGIGSAVNLFWGILLSGLPPAVFAPIGGPIGTALTTLGLFVGTSLFGRGVALGIAARPVERIVITDRRAVLLASEGVCKSAWFEHLRNRPIVVGREDNKATLALGAEPLPASRPLPARGLVGFYDMDAADAQALASEVMTRRRALLEDEKRLRSSR